MSERANRYEPIFNNTPPVRDLPYAQAMNQGADVPPRAAATMTLDTPYGLQEKQRLAFQAIRKYPNELDQFMSAVALEGAKMSRPIMQDMYGENSIEYLEALRASDIISPEGIQKLAVLKAQQAQQAQQARVEPTMDDASNWKHTSAAGHTIEIRNGERDPNGVDPHTPGAKLDAGKVPVRKGALEQFPRALMAVAAVSAHGAQKYTWGGWQTVPDGVQRYLDAGARHATQRACGEEIDKDSGLSHLAQEAWNILAALELELRSKI